LGIVMLESEGRHRIGLKKMECGDLEKIRFKSPLVFPFNRGKQRWDPIGSNLTNGTAAGSILAVGMIKKGNT
jgi:hypothetical protein